MSNVVYTQTYNQDGMLSEEEEAIVSSYVIEFTSKVDCLNERIVQVWLLLQVEHVPTQLWVDQTNRPSDGETIKVLSL